MGSCNSIPEWPCRFETIATSRKCVVPLHFSPRVGSWTPALSGAADPVDMLLFLYSRMNAIDRAQTSGIMRRYEWSPKAKPDGMKRECDGRTQTGRFNRSRPRDCRADWRSRPAGFQRFAVDYGRKATEASGGTMNRADASFVYESSVWCRRLREGEGESGSIAADP